MNELNGSKMLKTTGIIMIVFNAIAIALVLLLVIGLAISADVMFNSYEFRRYFNDYGYYGRGYDSIGMAAVATILIVFGIIEAAFNVFGLISGILASKHSNNPNKVGTLFVLGIINVVIAGLGVIFSGGVGIISLVLPILYLVGAVQNRKQVQMMNAYNQYNNPNAYQQNQNYNQYGYNNSAYSAPNGDNQNNGYYNQQQQPG